METTIHANHNFVFTDNAREKLNGALFSFPGPPVQIIPAVGDLVQFPGLESFIFVVLVRRFEYCDTRQMTITFLLDVAQHQPLSANLKLVP